MHRVHLNYALTEIGADTAGADDTHDVRQRGLHHPLMALLDAIHQTGSISGAARHSGYSYRHVWGELKRWETELGRGLLVWSKGQAATLAPFGEKLLWAERRAQARLAPQIEALRSELERAFAVAFDDGAGVIAMHASHDPALPRLRQWLHARNRLHLDLQFSGSVDALTALNDGECLLAGFHALTDHDSTASLGSPTAQVYRPLLKPGKHKLIRFATRMQGLMLAPLSLRRIASLRDLTQDGVRFVNRARGTGTRVVLEELLAAARLDGRDIAGFDHSEPSHEAAAEAVASGAADAAFGIKAAAAAKCLRFVPVAREQYFLVTLAANLEHPHVVALRAALAEPAWQQALHALPGYTAARSGEVVSLRKLLPWWNVRTSKARASAHAGAASARP